MKRQSKLVLMASLLSLINLTVGDTQLRVSMGIIVFVVGVLLFKEINPISLSFSTGVGVFIIRLIEGSFITGLNGRLILSYSLEIIFYITYGLFFYILVRKEDKKQNNPLILLLMICDFGANAMESLFRYSVSDFGLVTENFTTIFLVAFVRSALIWITWRIISEHIEIGEEKKL
ncbi:MAG: hypothetical protein Q4E02_00140 [Lagierella massiliensis]|nr:hypothetical protein [Lagierella massiliensis]